MKKRKRWDLLDAPREIHHLCLQPADNTDGIKNHLQTFDKDSRWNDGAEGDRFVVGFIREWRAKSLGRHPMRATNGTHFGRSFRLPNFELMQILTSRFRPIQTRNTA